jgi:hypothetical protein
MKIFLEIKKKEKNKKNTKNVQRTFDALLMLF